MRLRRDDAADDETDESQCENAQHHEETTACAGHAAVQSSRQTLDFLFVVQRFFSIYSNTFVTILNRNWSLAL